MEKILLGIWRFQNLSKNWFELAVLPLAKTENLGKRSHGIKIEHSTYRRLANFFIFGYKIQLELLGI